MLLFALGLSVCVGVLFGLVPLVQARAMSLLSPLADSGRTTTGSRGWRRVRSALVVGQVALSLTLLSGSTLMASTLMDLLNTDIGFDTTPVLAASIQLNTPGSLEEGRERVWNDGLGLQRSPSRIRCRYLAAHTAQGADVSFG